MGALISSAILAVAGSFGLRVLLALGISISSFAGLDLLVNNSIAFMQVAYSGISADSLQILNLAGIGESLGIILGGFVSRAAIKAAGVFAGSISG